MQGRGGQGDNRESPLDCSATAGFRRSDLTGGQRRLPDTSAAQRAIEQRRLSEMTGEMRAMPKRPTGMTHLDQPPPTTRVARPKGGTARKKRSFGQRLLIWAIALIIGVPVIIGVAYGVTNLVIALSVSAGAANVSNDFLAGLKSANYDQSFNDLNPALTLQFGKTEFKQQALADDHCYGQVTDYHETDNSAVTSSDGNQQSFAFTMTRSKLKQSYQLKLTLIKDVGGDWSITSYGTDLGPAPPTCK